MLGFYINVMISENFVDNFTTHVISIDIILCSVISIGGYTVSLCYDDLRPVYL